MRIVNKSTISNALFLIALLALFSLQSCVPSADKEAPQKRKSYAIAIHGGAGVMSTDMPEDRQKAYKEGLTKALATGEEILKNGGSSLDAVEATIRVLENDPQFNAGRGAVFTSEGNNELDAAIMDGNSLNAGAITGVRTVKNPISLARKVMTESKHVFFSWEGAETFADQFPEIERVENEYFHTERRRRALERAQSQESSYLTDPEFWEDRKFGTVGCVALDTDGRLAAGTSTGGMTNKKYGRVGDVPIIGSGTYADSVVAVSATGWGEKIMLNVTAHTVAAVMRYGDKSLKEATDFVIHNKLEPATAGIITVDRYGNIEMPFNTSGMFRASANSDGDRTVAIFPEE